VTGKPTYVISAWHETRMWVGTVDRVLHGGDKAALRYATQARGYRGVETMARDLIATVLDVDEDTFDVQVRYEPARHRDFACRCPCAGCRYDCRLHTRGSNRRNKQIQLITKRRSEKRKPEKDEEEGRPRTRISRSGYFGRPPRKLERLARYHEALACTDAHNNPVPRPKVGGARHTKTARA
jgi:hypothetical protein